MLPSYTKIVRIALVGWVCGVVLLTSPVAGKDAEGEDSSFEQYDIRVIRPKFFTKRQRFELGAEFLIIMNDTFVYTLMASGILTYHFSETLAAEAALAVGQSVNRNEKDVLFDEFKIKTQVFRTLYFGEALLLYTPIYGKVQLPGGRLVYFDSFLAAGGGMTGVEWKYSDYCQDESANQQEEIDIPPDRVGSYPTAVIGLGQRIFYSKSAALRWDLRNHSIFYSTADSGCDQENPTGGTDTQNNITLQIGASKFF